ncbi:prophage tail fiber N-terminal domain-containing protein, partial [Escherichia coli]|uniref:prophage tail fiber N-terminal domain-containing protein n=1 Tax=Escherichia coli TaxID=562 RepID=UPI003DA2BB8E
MAVKISGVLKDGTGKPVENCTIQLKARRTSSTVQRGLMFRRPCRCTGYGQTNGCGQNGGIKFTHNYLSLFCNKKGAISGARIWVIK